MTPETASVAERAAAGEEIFEDGQQGLFDVVIENELLEAALERRQQAIEKAKKPRQEEQSAKDAVKGIVEGIPEVASFDVDTDEPLTIRCGRFRIKVSAVKGNHVSFDTEPRKNISLSLFEKVK